jgi:sulfite exporter TauE/SafE
LTIFHIISPFSNHFFFPTPYGPRYNRPNCRDDPEKNKLGRFLKAIEEKSVVLQLFYESVGQNLGEMSGIGVIMIGILIGVGHSFEIDHIIAVTNLINQKENIQPWKIGASWGIGHSITTAVVGMLFVVFDINVSENFSNVGEIAVGITLIYLGLRGMVFDERINTHIHKHGSEFGHLNPMQKKEDWSLRSLMIGIIHGVVGTGFLIILIVATSNDVVGGSLIIISFCCTIIILMGIIGHFWEKIQKIHRKNIGKISAMAGIIAGVLLIIT